MGLWSLPWEGCGGSSCMGDEEAVVASLPSSGLSMVGCTCLMCLTRQLVFRSFLSLPRPNFFMQCLQVTFVLSQGETKKCFPTGEVFLEPALWSDWRL